MADSIYKRIISCLAPDVSETGKAIHHNIRVEAGAGSGKTYSLNRVVEAIQNGDAWREFRRRGQRVACITYTNAAVDVIKSRLREDSFIDPSTIHAFVWRMLDQFSPMLPEEAKKCDLIRAEDGDPDHLVKVIYNLGLHDVKDGTLYLSHNDVLIFFCHMMQYPRFRQVLTSMYPLILIDEYQDTEKKVMDTFVEYFISRNTGPQFALFGDEWQTIYENGCGKVTHDNLKYIPKKVNFRSAAAVVNMLNRLRPDLPQTHVQQDDSGEIYIVHCKDYTGVRNSSRYYKGDLPDDELKRRINSLLEYISNNVPQGETVKALVPTHKRLAMMQDYGALHDSLLPKNSVKDMSDDHLISYVRDLVEPVWHAMENDFDSRTISEILKGARRILVNTRAQKRRWHQLYGELAKARKKSAIDVLTVIEKYEDCLPLSSGIQNLLSQYKKNPNDGYPLTRKSVKDMLDISYEEYATAANFLGGLSKYSTDHGVKGEEYDNVVVVIGRGWNKIQFEKHLKNHTQNQDSFNRNLFYVCCSRAIKRLFFFITIPFDFQKELQNLTSECCMLPYNQFLSKPLKQHRGN